MNKYIILTKVMFKSLDAKMAVQRGKNGKVNVKQLLLLLLIVVAFLPLAGSIGTIVAVAYDMLAALNQEAVVLGIGFAVVSMAVFFFGIFYIMSVFYFSRDIENLLPLPLKPMHILGAKFTVTLFYEYLTELLFLAPIIVVYGIKSGSGVVYYLFSLIVFLILPVVPLVYASLINMVVMRVTNIARDKDKFRIIGGIVAMLFAVGMNFYIQKFASSGMSVERVQQLLQQGNNSLLGTISKLFPTNRPGILALANSGSLEGLLQLLLFIAGNLLFVAIFLLVGERFYFKGVVGVTQATASKKRLSRESFNKLAVQSSSLKSYTIKELKLLFRTPIYFMNCVLMNFLWPFFLLLPFITQPEQFKAIRELNGLTEHAGGIILAGAFALSLFVSSTNAIASTAISREGQNLFVCRYLPVSFERQINAKVLAGIIVSLIGTVMMLGVAVLLVRVPVYFIVLAFIVSLLSIVFCNYLGILIDLNYPKLNWDNEQKAVKQNLNVLINMLLCIVVAAIPVILAAALHLGVWKVFIMLVIIWGIADAVLYMAAMTWGASLFEKLEG